LRITALANPPDGSGGGGGGQGKLNFVLFFSVINILNYLLGR